MMVLLKKVTVFQDLKDHLEKVFCIVIPYKELPICLNKVLLLVPILF